MKLNRKAFTLTELLIALGVIGILAAILMPVIMNILPDQNALMAKRAYYATQTIISDIINNESCYPDVSESTDTNEKRIGFDDGYPRTNCNGWSDITTDSDGNVEEKNADSKFQTLFKKELDIKTENSNGFLTKDGIQWLFAVAPDTYNFNKIKLNGVNTTMSYIDIYVDVNGKEKPNRLQGSDGITTLYDHAISAATDEDLTYDTFCMRVYANGKIDIDPQVALKSDGTDVSWARNAVDVSKDITGQ